MPKTSALFSKTFVHLILIALIGIIVYSNTFNAPFQWDEMPYVIFNPIVKDLGYFLEPSEAKGLEFYSALKNRYIGYLTFALNYKLHGFDVTGYHVFNITIHLLNAILVYFLVMLTFRTPFLEEFSLKEKSGYIALFSALLFVSHPIQTEAVTYIFQRFAPLCAFFYLLSLILYIKSRLATTNLKSLIFYFLSLISAILAMKTKENAFTLPLIIALYEFSFFTGRTKKRVFYLIPLLLTMLIIPLTLIDIHKPLSETISSIIPAQAGPENISRWQYLFTQFRVIVTYIRLLFLPINQNIDYDCPIFHSFFNPQVFLSFIFLFSIFSFAIYLFYLSRTKGQLRLLSFGIFWFFITLSVESSIIPIPMIINEYRVYLPSAGVFIGVAGGISLLSERLKDTRFVLSALAVGIIILLLEVLTVATYARNAVWKSEISLWTDTVRKSPEKARVHSNLALAYYNKGLIDEAIGHYEIAIKLKPDHVEAHNNIGLAYMDKGLTDKAIEHYQIAIKLAPNTAETHNNLASAYMDKGLTDRAIGHYEITTKLKPDHVGAHYNLGLIYLENNSLDKALKEFKAVLQINPNDYQVQQFINHINKISPP